MFSIVCSVGKVLVLLKELPRKVWFVGVDPLLQSLPWMVVLVLELLELKELCSSAWLS